MESFKSGPVTYTDKTEMPFGKYKGTQLGNVPDKYLYDLYCSGKAFGAMRTYLLENIDSIKSNLGIKDDRPEPEM